MTREEYIAAVGALIKHELIHKRIRDVSEELAREVGDDFGGLALIPHTPLRAAFIEVVQRAVGDYCKLTKYLLDEALSMKRGGMVEREDGVKFPIVNAATCWTAIQAMKEPKK